MSERTECLYIDVFTYINEKVMPLNCMAFMSDYERAMRNAFQKVMPGTQMTACWFHFVQACKRNAKKVPKMIRMIRSDTTAEQIYRQLLCLPLLPHHEIQTEFEKIKHRAIALNAGTFRPFLKYYEKQWLKKVSFFFIINIHCNFT